MWVGGGGELLLGVVIFQVGVGGRLYGGIRNQGGWSVDLDGFSAFQQVRFSDLSS